MVPIALLHWIIVLLAPFIRENFDHKSCNDECSVFLAEQTQVIARSFPYPTKREIRVQHLGYYFMKSSVLQHNGLIFIITIQFSGRSAENKYVQVIFLLVQQHPPGGPSSQFPEESGSYS